MQDAAVPTPPAGPAPLAPVAVAWLADQRPALVIRSIGTSELGPTLDGAVLLMADDGERAGGLLRGAADATLAAAGARLLRVPGGGAAIETVTIPFDDAVAAGLTCGGTAEVLIQRLDRIPGALWEALTANAPAVLATRLDPPPHGGRSLVVRDDGGPDGSLGDDVLDRLAIDEGRRLVRSPGGGTVRLHVSGVPVLIETWNPAPRLVMVGDVALSAALADLAGQLGWHPAITTDVADSLGVIEQLGPNDLVVVIEHRPSIATPALTAALRRQVGYVGALGSRRTQVARRAALREAGATEADLSRLYGPTGLDLGARSPLESAISIVAEIIAVRAGRDARPLRFTDTRISG
ncbi:MAG: XdhC family protein [Acidimicrobiales bacterium]